MIAEHLGDKMTGRQGYEMLKWLGCKMTWWENDDYVKRQFGKHSADSGLKNVWLAKWPVNKMTVMENACLQMPGWQNDKLT